MEVRHNFPKGLSKEEDDRLDGLISESMQLCFDLQERGVDNPKRVLLRGTDIIDE